MSHTMWRMMASDAKDVEGAKLAPGLIRRVGTYAKPYTGMLIGFLGTIVAAALLGLAAPLLFRRILDVAVPNKDNGQLTLLALLVIAAAIGTALLGLAERFWSARIGEGLIYDLRSELFNHVQRLPISFFTRTQTGSLISRLNNDVIGAQRAFTGTLGTVVSNVITVSVTLIAMAGLDWRLTILSVLLLPLFIIPAKRIGQRMAGITRSGMENNAEMNNIMTERFGVSGAMLVKTYGNYQREHDTFASRAATVRDIGIRGAMLTRTFMAIMGLLGAMGTAAVYWYGGTQVINGDLTTGTLVALAAFVVRIYEPLTALTNARVDVMSAFVSFDRVFEVLDAPNPLTDDDDAIVLENAPAHISFNHVSFRYPSGDDPSVASLEGLTPKSETSEHTELPLVLEDIDVDVAEGSMVALVGPSGAGKSTLIALITRLYDPTSGSIEIGGHDIKHVTQDSLRAGIGVVAQDPHLFHTSVMDNLRYARPDATDAEVRDACRAAQILSVIEALPDGFDTIVGERGYRLSGGEKQRLAIARMLIRDPKIVILDEATSQLDTENERLVQEALKTALQGRTSFVIAHRLSTITAADQILVMKAGKVHESGRHDELIELDGLYADLFHLLVSREEAAELA